MMIMSQILSRAFGHRTVTILEPCIFCQAREWRKYENFLISLPPGSPTRRRAALSLPKLSRRHYAQGRMSQAREDYDERARYAFYRLNNEQKILHIEASKAEQILQSFLLSKSKMDHRSNVKLLQGKYKVDLNDVASLAIVTFRVPDIADAKKRAMMPPSHHKAMAGSLLQGCADAGDSLALVQIMTAIYLSRQSTNTAVKEITRLVPATGVTKYQKLLDQYNVEADKSGLGPDILVLRGLFLERNGKKQAAKALYEKALALEPVAYSAGMRHPMQFRLLTPWNALGLLMKNDVAQRSAAKAFFEIGALKGDDPLSYYELASFEPKLSTNWLQYMSKAAASGHQDAMIELANFYEEVGSSQSSMFPQEIRNALNWLLKWRSDGSSVLSREWRQAAVNSGHKPSMLKLADYYEKTGEGERVTELFQQMAAPPKLANQAEEWPQLVHLAQKRLAGIRISTLPAQIACLR